jgi:hypothetical protein
MHLQVPTKLSAGVHPRLRETAPLPAGLLVSFFYLLAIFFVLLTIADGLLATSGGILATSGGLSIIAGYDMRTFFVK